MPKPQSPKQITHQFASVLLDTGSLATSLVIGVATAHAAWTLAPTHWFSDLRIIAAGALCLVAAATSEGFLGVILAPLRRSLWVSPPRTAIRTAEPVPPAAATPEEGIAQITAATIADSAHRAAIASWSVDHGALFNSEERWRGYDNGDATFYLTPGTVLHYHLTDDRHPQPEFTLLTSEADDPVDVLSVRDVLQHLVSRKRAEAQAEVKAQAALAKEVGALPAAQGPEAAVEQPAF